VSRILPRGLYAITPGDIADGDELLEMIRQGLAGGARTVQYRDKGSDLSRRREQAQAIGALCREYDAAFVVNDDLGLALDVRADGVHLGGADLPCGEARRQAGPGFLIGVSCYDSLTSARGAIAQGASYVAFGSAYPSPTKPAAVEASLALYRRAAGELDVPVVAIGGITPENAPALISAGCHAVAVISSLFGAADIRGQARAFSALFEPAAAADRLE
jgi:thiamine-phosphate pyrophosphorylase